MKENQVLAGNIRAWKKSTGNLRMTKSGNIFAKSKRQEILSQPNLTGAGVFLAQLQLNRNK